MSDTKNWKELFVEKHARLDYGPEEIQELYLISMELQSYFFYGDILPNSLTLENIEKNNKEIHYFWRSNSEDADCTKCHQKSSTRYDQLTTHIQDIPSAGCAVYHHIIHNRFQCLNSECEQKIFVEKFSQFTEETSRKTLRFKRYCIERALGCGCFGAQNEIRSEGGVVSNDSIERYIKKESAEIVKNNLTQDNVRVISLDDINLRKGDRSSGCTVFIDEETHKVLVIVRGTTKEVTQKIIEKFTSSEIMSRDRASAYSSAGSACGKPQIADRFHLIQNAQAAVKNALMAEIPFSIFIRNGDGWQTENGDEADISKPFSYVKEEIVEERINLAGLTPAKAKKYRETLKMLELSDKGMRSADIAKEMGIVYKDVQKLRGSAASTLRSVEEKINKRAKELEDLSAQSRTEIPGERASKTVAGSRVRPAKESIVEEYRQTVVEMWNAGENHRTIYPVLVSQGYTGSQNAIYQYILKLKKDEPDILTREKTKKTPEWSAEFDEELAKNRPELSLENVSRNTVYQTILHEASAEREKNAENPQEKESAPKPQSTRPASVKTSPLDSEILDLMYGPDAPDDGKTKTVKKN